MVNLCNVLAVCGNGHLGRLGLGPACSSQHLPRIVGSLIGYNIKEVACGGAHTAVVTDDGSLFTFGANQHGQCGHSEKEKFVPVPVEVVLPDPIDHVAAGEYHTLCLTRAGEVWAWGSHESGALGIGSVDETIQRSPRLVKALSGAGVQQLAAGAEHSLALAEGGTAVYSWGSDGPGVLGLGPAAGGRTRSVQLQPVRLRGSLDSMRLRQVAAGLYTSGAVDDAGRAWTWGMGSFSQLGHGKQDNEARPKQDNEARPKQVTALANVASLALGHLSSWAVTRDGRAYCWGTDDMGSLAQGEKSWQKTAIQTPQESRTLPRCKSIAAGWKHAMAVSTEGKLYSWGWSGAYGVSEFGMDAGGGQLGVGEVRDHWEPVQVQRLHTSSQRFYDLRMSYVKPWKVLQASCGRNHSAMVVQVHLDTRDVGA